MSRRKQSSFTELRVGIFVVISCAILAVAIFLIGSQVGLFQEQFWAMTYLSNVSGLKPGDIVLLGGVEVGNVAKVEISPNLDPPDTMQNQQVLHRVSELEEQRNDLEQKLAGVEEELATTREEYRRIEAESGIESAEALEAERALEDLTASLTDLRGDLINMDQRIADARSRLQNILVEMRVNSEYRNWIRRDSNISLGSIGLLGDKYIEISLGRTADPPEVRDVPVKGILGTTTRETVVITGTQQASFGELITGANDILANFETLSDQVQGIMRSFEAGEGTVGKFITDPSFFNNLNSTVENANRAMDRIRRLVENVGEGSSTLSRLMQDDEVYQKINSATDHLDRLLQKIEEGEGTLGKLVNDPSIYDESAQMVGNVGEITGRIRDGEGTLGKLTTDDQVYVSLQESLDKLAAVLKDVEEGKGTLGRLAKDEQLYNNLNELSAEIVKLIYDFRQNPKKFLTIRFTIF
jgi:phospholipid/cholesterol/gamma-HCH transport system substrate-binding protein